MRPPPPLLPTCRKRRAAIASALKLPCTATASFHVEQFCQQVAHNSGILLQLAQCPLAPSLAQHVRPNTHHLLQQSGGVGRPFQRPNAAATDPARRGTSVTADQMAAEEASTQEGQSLQYHELRSVLTPFLRRHDARDPEFVPGPCKLSRAQCCLKCGAG